MDPMTITIFAGLAFLAAVGFVIWRLTRPRKTSRPAGGGVKDRIHHS